MNRQHQSASVKGRHRICLLLSFFLFFGFLFSFSALKAAEEPPTAPSDSLYRTQLPTEKARAIYDLFLTLAEEGRLLRGTESVELVAAGIYENRRYDENELLSDFLPARDAFFLDHPEVFYVDPTRLSLRQLQKGEDVFILLGVGTYESYLADGLTAESAAAAYAAFQTQLDAVLAVADTEEGWADKLSAVSRECLRLVRRADLTAPEDVPHASDAYGALVKRRATALGYARMMKAVLDRLGIPSLLVQGTYRDDGGDRPHAWSLVKAEDGGYYLLDAAANDARSAGGASADLLQYASSPTAARYSPTPFVSFTPKAFAFAYPSISSVPYDAERTATSSPVPFITAVTAAVGEEYVTYTVTLRYSEALEKSAADRAATVTAVSAPTGTAVTGVSFDKSDKCKVTFTFKALISSNENVAYTFRLVNAIGKESRSVPLDAVVPSASEPTVLLPTGEGDLYRLSSEAPVLMSVGGLSQNKWYDANGDELPDGLPLQLSLVAEPLSQTVRSAMTEALHERGVTPSAALFYELSLFLAEKEAVRLEGGLLPIYIPYPERDIGDKAIQVFGLDEDGALLPVPCTQTANGVLCLLDRTGPLVVLTAHAESNGDRTVILTSVGAGSCLQKFVTVSASNGGTTLSFVPDEGYAVDTLRLNGVEVTASTNAFPLLYGSMKASGNLIEVSFAPEELLREEREDGLHLLIGDLPEELPPTEQPDFSLDLTGITSGLISGTVVVGTAIFLSYYNGKKRKK